MHFVVLLGSVVVRIFYPEPELTRMKKCDFPLRKNLKRDWYSMSDTDTFTVGFPVDDTVSVTAGCFQGVRWKFFHPSVLFRAKLVDIIGRCYTTEHTP